MATLIRACILGFAGLVFTVEDALNKLSRLLPAIVKQSDETPGAVGTYVVNRDGGPLGVEIPLKR